MYVLCDECFLSRYLISSFHAFLYDRSGEEMDELMLKPVCYSFGVLFSYTERSCESPTSIR